MSRTWKQIVQQDPDHSRRYADRWDAFLASGTDIDGEARLIDALAPRGARILDAGCGQGRTGAYLAEHGHIVTGVDIDPVLIERARERCPEASWELSDLAADNWAKGPFDLIVSAGNVLAFVDPADRRAVLSNLARRLAPTAEATDHQPARLIAGFGLDRGWDLDTFTRDAAESGLRIEQSYSTWTLSPFSENSGFLVAILVAADHLPR